MPPLFSRSIVAFALALALSLSAPVCLAEPEQSPGPRVRVTLPEAWTPERLAELEATREATWKRISFEADGIGLGEAMVLIEQALRVDPDHLPANAMRRVFAKMVEPADKDGQLSP